MTTLTATRAAATFPVSGGGMAGTQKTAYGTYSFATNPLAGTTVEFCRVPKGAVVVGGRVFGHQIDTSTEAFDMDIGYSGNGVESTDTDAFGNFGVWAGAAVAGTKPEVGYNMHFGGVLFATAGAPPAFSAETVIIGTVNASAAVFTVGAVTVVVDYIVP